MTSESKKTIETIYEQLLADKVTCNEANNMAWSMRARLACIMEDMAAAGYEDVEELQATYDVLDANEHALHKAARTLPMAYMGGDEDEEREELMQMLHCAHMIAQQEVSSMVERHSEDADEFGILRLEVANGSGAQYGRTSIHIRPRMLGDMEGNSRAFDDVVFGLHENGGPRYEELGDEARGLADEALAWLEFDTGRDDLVAEAWCGTMLDWVMEIYEGAILAAYELQQEKWDEAWGTADEAPVVSADDVILDLMREDRVTYDEAMAAYRDVWSRCGEAVEVVLGARRGDIEQAFENQETMCSNAMALVRAALRLPDSWDAPYFSPQDAEEGARDFLDEWYETDREEKETVSDLRRQVRDLEAQNAAMRYELETLREASLEGTRAQARMLAWRDRDNDWPEGR